MSAPPLPTRYSTSISGSRLRIFAKSTRRPALLLYEPAAPDEPTRQNSEPLVRSPSRFSPCSSVSGAASTRSYELGSITESPADLTCSRTASRRACIAATPVDFCIA